MMRISDIKAAVTVVRTLREDWHRVPVEAQLTELAGKYDHPDVLYAAVVIARDLSNQLPVTLTIKAPDLLATLHSKTATNRTPGPGKRDQLYLCDVCSLNEDRCQAHPSNVGGRDHAFVSIARADAARDEQHGNGRNAAARAAFFAGKLNQAAGLVFPKPDDTPTTHKEAS